MLWTAYLHVIYMMLFGFPGWYTLLFGDAYKLSQDITGLSLAVIEVSLLISSVTRSRWRGS